MQTLRRDLRYGARMLLKNSGFTLIAVLTLALGIGANTAIFTVINAVLLRPLPYQDAERLAVVATTMRRDTVEVRSASYPDFVDWRGQNTVFERLAAHTSTSFTLTGGAEPERVDGELASADYFPLLRAQAAMGRTFLPEEDRTPDAHRVALVGHGLWQRSFGGDAALVGRTSQLNGAVCCVLLVACANVANLQLQRAAGRSLEMAVRLALGATTRRLIRQLLTESLLLALIGGALGALLALLSVDFLIKLSPVTFPSFVNLRLDARVLGFSLLISVLTGATFGLAPALQAARPALNESLKAGGRNSSGGLGRNRLLSSLVVSEIALALTLLIGAGLMIRSLQRLQAVDPGFNSECLLTMRVSLPAQSYRRDQIVEFSQQLRERLESLPRAQSVALASDLPLSGSTSAGPLELEGRPATASDGEIRMYRHRVTTGFFSTLGIPLIKGRDFTAGDNAQSPGVVIISEAMARRYWPNENPIGKRLREDSRGAPAPDPWLSIVGVIGEVKYRGLPQNPNADPDVYFPLLQAPNRNLFLAIRADADPVSLVAAVRGALHKQKGKKCIDVNL